MTTHNIHTNRVLRTIPVILRTLIHIQTPKNINPIHHIPFFATATNRPNRVSANMVATSVE